MNPPTHQRDVQKFIGIVNYYQGMYPRRSHMLAPLTRTTSNKVTLNGLKSNQMHLMVAG